MSAVSTRVVHLVPSRGTVPCAAFSRMVPLLPSAEWEHRVVVLGRETRASPSEAGMDVRWVPVRSGIDPAGWRAVARAIGESRPDIVHAWGPSAARLAWLSLGRHDGPKRVVSVADRPEPGGLGRVTGRAVRSADRVLAFGPAEFQRYRDAGIPESRLAVAPLGVTANPRPVGDARVSHGPPFGVPYVVAVGGPGEAGEMADAVWAFDVIHHAHPTARLVVAGDAAVKGPAERLARAVGGTSGRITFLGSRPDRSALAGAAAVWVPARFGGTDLALEALAAGGAVVGYRTPDLEAVIDDGRTGFLVPPGDRVALSSRTMELLENTPLRDRIVTAGREAAATRFPPGPVADAVAAVYHALTRQIP